MEPLLLRHRGLHNVKKAQSGWVAYLGQWHVPVRCPRCALLACPPPRRMTHHGSHSPRPSAQATITIFRAELPEGKGGENNRTKMQEGIEGGRNLDHEWLCV